MSDTQFALKVFDLVPNSCSKLILNINFHAEFQNYLETHDATKVLKAVLNRVTVNERLKVVESTLTVVRAFISVVTKACYESF